jgi:hypothetical protein
MTDKKSTVEELDRERTLKGVGEGSVGPIVELAKVKGWASISVEGNWELCRAAWFEGKMVGLEVRGYRPTRRDDDLLQRMQEFSRSIPPDTVSMRGVDVVRDYDHRVLPYLRKEFHELERERRKLGIFTDDHDRAYQTSRPIGRAREIDEKYSYSKDALIRALTERERFLSHPNKAVPISLSFQDGIARIVEKDEPNKNHNRELNRSRGRGSK